MHRVYSPSIINNVNYLAFFVIIVFIFFDGIRSNIVYNEYFSMIREGSLLYLILMTSLSCNIKKTDRLQRNPVHFLSSFSVFFLFPVRGASRNWLYSKAYRICLCYIHVLQL